MSINNYKKDFKHGSKFNHGGNKKRGFGDSEKRSTDDNGKPSFGDKGKRDFGDSKKRSFGGENKRNFGDDNKRGFNDGKRSFGNSEKRSTDDNGKPSFGDKGKRDFGDSKKRSFGGENKRSFGDDNKRGFNDGKRSFGDSEKRSTDDKGKPSFGDKGKRDFGDSKKRSFGGENKRSFGDDNKRGFNDGKRSFGDSEKRSTDDKGKPSFGDKGKRDFGDSKKRSFGGENKRSFGDDNKRGFNDGKRSFGDKDKRSFGDKGKHGFGDSNRSFGDKDKRSFGDDNKRNYGDDNKRSFGDKGKHSFGDSKRSFANKRKRSFGDRSKRSSYGSMSEVERNNHEKDIYKRFDENRAAHSGVDENLDSEVQSLVIAGRNAVLEALKTERAIEKLYIKSGEINGSLKEIIARAKELGLTVMTREKEQLDEISSSTSHQGVVAIAAAFEYSSVSDILDYAESKGEAPFIILLDSVTDPYNLGAILRTSLAAGAHGVVIPKRRAVGLTGGVVKSSAGAYEHIRVAKTVNLRQTLIELKSKGIWSASLSLDGGNIYQRDLRGPIALVVGGEDNGVSRIVESECDYKIKIPMTGPIGSLNASVAASVAVYELVRQRSEK